MSITKQIEEIIKPYLFQEEDGELSVYDSQVPFDIEELFIMRKVPYKINAISCKCDVDCKQQYYIYSWIENNELYTYELLLYTFIKF